MMGIIQNKLELGAYYTIDNMLPIRTEFIFH